MCARARVLCALVRVSFIIHTSRVEWELPFGEFLSEVQGQGLCFFALSLFREFLSGAKDNRVVKSSKLFPDLTPRSGPNLGVRLGVWPGQEAEVLVVD